MTAFLAYLAAVALALEFMGAVPAIALGFVLVWIAAGFMVPRLFARDEQG